MADVIFEKVLANAQALSPEDQRQLIDLLAARQRIEPWKALERLAAEQGKNR